jgi:hypothetical protein
MTAQLARFDLWRDEGRRPAASDRQLPMKNIENTASGTSGTFGRGMLLPSFPTRLRRRRRGAPSYHSNFISFIFKG